MSDTSHADWPLPTQDEWRRLYSLIEAFQRQGVRMVDDHHKSYDTTIEVAIGPWGQHNIGIHAYVFSLDDGGRHHYPPDSAIAFSRQLDWLERMVAQAKHEADLHEAWMEGRDTQ